MRNRLLSAVIVALIVLCRSAPPVLAQGINVQVLPKAGLYMPLNALTDDAELDNAFAIGVAGELVLPGLPFNLRANLDYANTMDIAERSAAETVFGEATLLAVTGDIVLRPLARTGSAHPYFMGGAGIKTYDIRLNTAAPPSLVGMDGTTTRFTFHVGGGVDVRLGPLSLVLEIGDYVGSIETGEGDTRWQNDVFGMMGFRVAMF
jgi:opacity protein-like surface antigen